MTQKELIEHLKGEVKRVKEQRNDYEQRWFKAMKELEDIRRNGPLTSNDRLVLAGLDNLIKLRLKVK